ncbi:MAG: RibD family protein [bacterium]
MAYDLEVADRPLTLKPLPGEKRALFLLKLALSLDGRIAFKRGGEPFYLTGSRSWKLVHRIRSQMDGVMVGAGTVRADNPRLDCRLVEGRNPWKIVVSAAGDLPDGLNIFEKEPEKTIIAVTGRIPPEKKEILAEKGVSIIICREDEGQVDLHDLAVRLAERGIDSILLEGGALLAASALKKKLVDRVIFFYAPLIIGGGNSVEGVGDLRATSFSGIRLTNTEISRSGDDFLIDGYPSMV